MESQNRMQKTIRALACALSGAAVLACAAPAQAQPSSFTVRLLTPETALKAAQAALAKCRAAGFQVAVAVTDRMGVLQVLLRDRYAGPHTPDMAGAKAWTAVSFRVNTTELADATQPGKAQSGVRHRPGVAAVGGGMMIESGGALLGAIGVSGAPGGSEDDACASAGLAAVRDELELEN
jgi:uncharacterized protein GlcG (DUF336 family)